MLILPCEFFGEIAAKVTTANAALLGKGRVNMCVAAGVGRKTHAEVCDGQQRLQGHALKNSKVVNEEVRDKGNTGPA